MDGVDQAMLELMADVPTPLQPAQNVSTLVLPAQNISAPQAAASQVATAKSKKQ